MKQTISWAQNGEDIVLRRALHDIDNGFYVDVGAADPDLDSVTRIFYDLGWSGINIEPNPADCEKLRHARTRDINLDCAAGASDGDLLITLFQDTGLSTLVPEYSRAHEGEGYRSEQRRVTVRPLASILDENRRGPVHFLKIDVEGFELPVLEGLNLARHRPWIIVYECTEPNTNIVRDNGIPELLELHDYLLCFFDGLNKFYVAKEHVNRRALLYPSNILDNFRKFDVASTLEHSALEAAEANRYAASLSADVENRLREFERAQAYAADLTRNLDERSVDLERAQDYAKTLAHDRAQSEEYATDLARHLAAKDDVIQAGTEFAKSLLGELDKLRSARDAGQGQQLPVTGKRVAFTICSINYLAYAKTLQESFRRHNGETTLFIFLADRVQLTKEEIGSEHVIYVDELVAPEFEDMATRYTIMEYNTAVKPHCIEYLMDRCGATEVLYLDPDIYVTHSLHHLFDLLQRSFDCLLTPHMMAPLDDGKFPDDLAIARAGIYNLGFFAVANRPSARRFLTWWRGWLENDCVVDLERGIFVDQRFCDFAPSFMEATCVLHDPGLNLAYWNLLHRPVEDRGGELFAAGSAVKFVHFSGISKSDPQQFSKHQNRFTRDTIGALRPLFDHYVAMLNERDRFSDGAFSQVPYGFSRFASGEALTDIHRMCIRRYKADLPAGRSAYDLGKDFFLAPADGVGASGDTISRMLMTVYASRADLRKVFDIATPAGRDALRAWAGTAFEREYKVDPGWALPLTGAAPQPVSQQAARPPRLMRVAHMLRRALVSSSAPGGITSPAPDPVAAVDTRPSRVVRHGLAVYGFLQAETGVGRAGRALAEAWATTHKPVSLHSFRPPHFRNEVIFPSSDSMVNDMDTALLAMNADNVRNLSNLVDPGLLAHNRKLGLFFWELPVFPGYWAQAGESLDEIWVATKFVKDGLSSAVSKPVRIVPLPVPLNDRDPLESRRALGMPLDRPLFLVTFDYNSFPQRKNPLAAVRAFLDAFPTDRPSGPMLIVKSHGVTNRNEWERALGELAAKNAHVRIIDAVFSDEDMLRLQAACDVYLSLHRSEGFGLNLAECMAAGKLAIGTNFSGNVDFMTSENSLLIGYSMKRVEEGEYPFATGQWWADPNHAESVAAIRSAMDPSLRSRLGQCARADISGNLSAEAIGARMEELVN